jgi:3'(2'), 5'-bisphosphate nucleotidase
MTAPPTEAPIIDRAAALKLLEPITALAAEASEAILDVARRKIVSQDKRDGSPVTEADLAADRIIVEGLRRLRPDIPVVSEESVSALAGPFSGSFFIVDPLDGTREFISGYNDYTVNIALVTQGRPLLGVVGAPALGAMWRGVVGEVAERATAPGDAWTAIHPRAFPGAGWVAAVSRSHLDSQTAAFIRKFGGGTQLPIGSALKFCRIAEGSADIYPRLSNISEWDIAAGHAVVEAAGGAVTSGTGQPIRFGARKGDFLVPNFIAWGDPAQAARLIE